MPQTKIHPVLAPLGGLRLDRPGDLIDDGEMTGAQNVSFENGMVRKRFGYVQKGDNLPLAGAIRGLDLFELFDGNKYLCAVDTKLAYKWLPNQSQWDTISEESTEDDCETNWTAAANVTSALDATDFKEGSNSVKLTVGAAFTTGVVAYHDAAFGDLTDYGFVRLWIKSSVATTAGQLQFLIDNTSACASPLETIDIPALAADTWTIVILEIDDPTALGAVASIGLNAASDPGEAIIRIDEIKFVKEFATTSDDDMVSFTSIRDTTQTDLWWIFSDGVNAIKKWTGSSDIEDLIASYPAGLSSLLSKHVLEFKTYLLLADTTEEGYRYRQRIRWSDTADPSDFLNGNASYVDLGGDDFIQTILRFSGDYVVVLREHNIWVGYATGDTDIFDFDEKVRGIGCSAPKSAIAILDYVFFMGWDNVYAFDGVDYTPIGDPVREEMFADLKPEQLARIFATHLDENQEYWLHVPTADDTYCTVSWCYNYKTKSWTKHSYADYLTAVTYYTKQSSTTIDELEGTINELSFRFDDRQTLASAPTKVFGDTSGYIFEYDETVSDDDDAAIDAWFTTKDFIMTQLTEHWRFLRMDVYFAGGGELDVSYSVDRGTSWSTAETLSANSDYSIRRVYWRIDSDMIRFRFRNANSGEHFMFREARIYWQPAGRRV